jgi:hypothetical protein
MKIAYFISPHGFGHAARACAVMQVLMQMEPSLSFEIFTRVPRWFFDESFLLNYTYHDCESDLGLVQRNSLQEDIPATIEKLARFLPFDSSIVEPLVAKVLESGCNLVLCDIAPLGIAVARKAGIPSVLIENFTWDWIYANYLEEAPAIQAHIDYLSAWFSQANYHIQTTPVCHPNNPHLTSQPVSRVHQAPPDEFRTRLGIPDGQPTVLITMGGIESEFQLLRRLYAIKNVGFIIPGSSKKIERRENCLLLPHHSGFYHPDLVRAADAVVGKLGYSTLAEAYFANRPFGFIPRSRFRESPPLARFVLHEMEGVLISEDDYESGEWINQLPHLLERSKNQSPRLNGAAEVVQFLLNLLRGELRDSS